jgi:hypothetical protein
MSFKAQVVSDLMSQIREKLTSWKLVNHYHRFTFKIAHVTTLVFDIHLGSTVQEKRNNQE